MASEFSDWEPMMFCLVLRLGFDGILLIHKTEIHWLFSSEVCLLQSVVCAEFKLCA